MKKIISFLAITLVFLVCAQASDLWFDFGKANNLYRSGQYSQAVTQYQSILDQGIENGVLYYNLANSYFKQGQLAKAVLNYERAKLFIPQDQDLRTNYQYVMSAIGLTEQYLAGTKLDRLWDKLFSRLTINFLTGICVFLWWMICLGFIAILFFGKLKKYIQPVCLINMIVLFFLVLAVGRKTVYFDRAAIILEKQQDAKFEPFLLATSYFSLPQGSLVEILETSQGWIKIRRFDGKIGWVDSQYLEKINNQSNPIS